MGPHLVWAFVVLCAVGAAVWWRAFGVRLASMSDFEQRLALAEQNAKSAREDAEAAADLARVTAAELKPIKTKFSAGQFGAIGGGR